jgi:hypothetical protein
MKSHVKAHLYFAAFRLSFVNKIGDNDIAIKRDFLMILTQLYSTALFCYSNNEQVFRLDGQGTSSYEEKEIQMSTEN